MTATAALTTDLQRQVLALESDLRDRLAADPDREGEWKREHHQAVQQERTAAPWLQWRDDRITQAAVAWVLTTVFLRFCEDNGLLKPVWITGPGSRRQEALDAQKEFFRHHAEETGREWLLDAVGYLAKLPATRGLVESHSALYLIAPSGDAADALLEFWRRRGEDGGLVHDLADPELSTRFLGDLYQDLSQHAKDTYALLQTPVFVEEFILDRTMEPALAERPLEGFKMIDPACGSGHFLLGAFARLIDRWHREAPDLDAQARVQKALDSVNGVDLNPFAVAIARFRLLLAALEAAGLRSLEQAPAFTVNLAVGDSLIHGPDPDVLPGMSDRSAYMPFTYRTEDADLLLTLLEEGSYDVVVGNPPYITARDKALNQIYRAKYTDVCKGKYALTVPFMKLMFSLAKPGETAGWVGQITSNSFTKREFGTKLIEDFLPRIDLRLVADTSGAFIPGHGTPTVIIVGRNQHPTKSTVRAILGIRGEADQPETAADGYVWTSIRTKVENPGWSDTWITVTDLERQQLTHHPWSLSGGGATDLLRMIEDSALALRTKTSSIGITSFTLEDEVYIASRANFNTRRVVEYLREMVIGEGLRDWASDEMPMAVFPYDSDYKPVDIADHLPLLAWMWPYKTNLSNNVLFGGRTKVQSGLRWTEYGRLTSSKLRDPVSIVFAAVATHNHFILDQGGHVFKQSTQVIKLPPGSTSEDYLALLAVLNSSAACFWLKQKCYAKTGTDNTSGGGNRWSPEPWYSFYDFNATTIGALPLPKYLSPYEAGRLDELARQAEDSNPKAICRRSIVPSREQLDLARGSVARIRMLLISLQEDLDWRIYKAYGLIEEDLTYRGGELPGIDLGERAFEIALARRVLNGEEKTAWFIRHGSTPTTELPAHWPLDYKELVRRRLELIESDPFIRLLERPEYKRRWAQESWEKRQERALREWLLDRLEDRPFWFDPQGRPRPRSIAQLADEVARDADLMSVLELWAGRPDIAVAQSLAKLMTDEAVPFLAAYRYKDSGLRKREEWERTWALQRREDAGERLAEAIPVPPKYAPADFRKPAYWHARGKLDVPKERFIAYPDAGRETDPTLLLGWVGWDHAQQSLALATIITEREAEGWPTAKLVPLVAGLDELQPWVEQWHAETDPAYGVSMATFCREQLTTRATQVGKTLAELRQWRPQTVPRRGRGPS